MTPSDVVIKRLRIADDGKVLARFTLELFGAVRLVHCGLDHRPEGGFALWIPNSHRVSLISPEARRIIYEAARAAVAKARGDAHG